MTMCAAFMRKNTGMNDRFGTSAGLLNIELALLIRRVAKSMHELASDDIAEAIGPPKVLDAFIFSTLNRYGLFTSMHAPRYIKCKLKITSAWSFGDSGKMPDSICCR